MRRSIEVMAKSKAAKNGEERVTTNRDNIRHLEYFNNGQWRHSSKCKEFTNRECQVKWPDSSLEFVILVWYCAFQLMLYVNSNVQDSRYIIFSLRHESSISSFMINPVHPFSFIFFFSVVNISLFISTSSK